MKCVYLVRGSNDFVQQTADFLANLVVDPRFCHHGTYVVTSFVDESTNVDKARTYILIYLCVVSGTTQNMEW